MNVQEYITNFEDHLRVSPPLQKEWVEVRDRMVVHTRGVKPTKLLKVKRPNEPDDLLKYRLATYRAITKDKINHAIDSVIRILLNSNYSVKYAPSIAKDIQGERFALYDDDIHEPLSLINLIVEHVTRFIFDDPNGCLVWLPVNPDDISIPPIQAQATSKIKVAPTIVDSTRIKDISKDHIVFEGAKMWIVEYDYGTQVQKKEHPYYFIVTKGIIVRMLPEWSNEKRKVVYVPQVWYEMGVDLDSEVVTEDEVLPFATFKMLGGNVTMNEKNQKYFESFFQSYSEFGDEAITAFSDNQAVRVRYNFPFTAVKADICPKCKGAKKVHAEGGNMEKCSTCDGAGGIIPFTPFNVFQKMPPSGNDNEAYALSDFIEFKYPDVAILESSFEAWQKFLEFAADSINFVHTDASQSGKAKEIDREEKHDMLFKITNNIFDLLKFSIDCYSLYAEPFKSERKLEDNIVTPPTNFFIKSQEDLFEELNELTAKQAPQPFINTTATLLSQKIYNGNAEVQKIIEVLTVWDVLFGKTDSQVGQLAAMNAVGDKEKAIHVHGYKILYQLSQTNELDKMKIEDIIKLAETKIVLPEQPVPLVDENGQRDE